MATTKKFQDLETLADQYLKLRPGDLMTLARVASASMELGHNEKWIQTLLEIYKIQNWQVQADERDE